jgi:endonuclease III
VTHSKKALSTTDYGSPSSASLKNLRVRTGRIVRTLEKAYGPPQPRSPADPLDVLIETVLSQATNDRNRDRAYRNLRTCFPRWEQVLQARTGSLAQAIRSAGLANQKSKRIRDILHYVRNRYGALSLEPLREMDSGEIQRILGPISGIGPKTIHCLLLFGLGRDAFPVDTHVLRTGKRLGLIPETTHAEQAHRWMACLVPKGKSLSLHLHLIRFGRSVCKARNPRCEVCFLRRECRSYSPA